MRWRLHLKNHWNSEERVSRSKQEVRCPGGERARRWPKWSEHMTNMDVVLVTAVCPEWICLYCQCWSWNLLDFSLFSERMCCRGEAFVTLFIGKWCIFIWLVYKCHIDWALFEHVDEYWMQVFMHTLWPYGPWKTMRYQGDRKRKRMNVGTKFSLSAICWNTG